MNTLPSTCKYDIGDASCASATYTIETRPGAGGKMDKILTFRGTMTGDHGVHSGTFRVFFYKGPGLTEEITEDGFITTTYTKEINLTPT